MEYIDSGKDDPPELEDHQCIFVDIWGNWIRYKDYTTTFYRRIDHYISSRKYDCSYFNANYIKQYKSK